MIAYFPIIYIFFYMFFLSLTVLMNIKLTQKQSTIINLLMIVSIALLSYNYVPTPDQDLSRYYHTLNLYSNYTWEYTIDYARHRNTPITNIYFYWMSRVGNYSLFAMVPTVINFGLVYIVSNKFIRKYNLKFQIFSFFIIGVISVAGLLGTISGIRQNLAWSLLMVAVYYDFFGERFNYTSKFLLYIIPVLIHTSTVPILILRLYLALIGKFRFLKYLIILWPVAIIIISGFYSYMPSVFQYTLDNFWDYTEGEIVSGFRFVSSLVGYLLWGLVIIKVRKINLNINNNFYNFFLLVFILGITSISIPTLFGRLFTFLTYISLPMIAILFKSTFNIKPLLVYSYITFFLISFLYKDILPGYFF